eukprot:gene42071-51085_t
MPAAGRRRLHDAARKAAAEAGQQQGAMTESLHAVLGVLGLGAWEGELCRGGVPSLAALSRVTSPDHLPHTAAAFSMPDGLGAPPSDGQRQRLRRKIHTAQKELNELRVLKKESKTLFKNAYDDDIVTKEEELSALQEQLAQAELPTETEVRLQLLDCQCLAMRHI